ncbi:aminofutalosine synthase MqnE [candidate division TA06 bacterium]|nr:aminofutalosine synthase MqnE [candidate division TA06 bacterium]
MERIQEIDFQDQRLIPIWERVQRGERIERKEGLLLFQTWDLMALGKMADFAKRKKISGLSGLNGDVAYFIIDRQINPTNICVYTCKFCDFAVRPWDEKAYEMTLQEILSKLSPEIREVHIVGGLHPKWKFDQYLNILREIKVHFPTIQIKAWTAVEIAFFSKIAKIPVEKVFERLLDAGLNTMPGGGAEVFSERVRQALFKQKIGAKDWLRIHRIAHGMGIRTNATLLYGHMETYEERVDHLVKLRELQDETGGFLTFIPLTFQPGHTGLVKRQASALEDLRTLAASRLLLDNFPHIKAYWVMLGEDTAGVGLHFGADDIAGTIGEERIAHAALAKSPVGLTRERLLEMIRGAGRTPVERDTYFNILRVYNGHHIPPPWPRVGRV